MKSSTKSALWIGGLVLGAGAIATVLVVAHHAQTPTGPAPTNPVPAGQNVTLDVAAGNSSAQISTQNGLNLVLQTGATLQNWSLDGTTQTGAATVPSGLSVGQHAVTVSWTDSSGTAQVSNITLTVTT